VPYAKLLFMSESYRYTVRFPSPLTHYAEVEAIFPAQAGTLDLFMAVWTPGSYLVREYSRHLEGVTAWDFDGQALTVRKTRKNRWQIETSRAGEVRVKYRVYCHEMSVRTNWVDETFAILQGAATYLSVVDRLHNPHEVTFVLPDGWSQTISGMTRMGAHTYLAGDYDGLVDSPVLLGNPDVHDFECGGKKHHLVNSLADKMWDAGQAVADVSRIVAKNLEMWGSLPYEEYWFLNLLVEEKGGGGLEHKNSCVLIASRYATRTRAGYVDWLELVSHEFFHVWNVKRLRPIELGPFDYENENYTRGLWVAEGFTEYYGSLMATRAGALKREEYLGGSLSRVIEMLQATPGRFTRSVELSSYDAWIKAYRPDENSINTTISYYIKGAVIAFLLDAKLRAAGAMNLDDVMRLAYERYSGATGFPEAAIQEIAGAVPTASTGELDYKDALELYGLRFKAIPPGPPKAWTGFTTKSDNGRLIVATVPRDTPAFESGLSADDEILAIDDSRVLYDQWAQRMEQLRPGDKVSLLISRRGKVLRADVLPSADPGKRWTLEVNPDATAAQREQLNAWLGQPQQP
jgi:predicted metalloprotease with PDZ domain